MKMQAWDEDTDMGSQIHARDPDLTVVADSSPLIDCWMLDKGYISQGLVIRFDPGQSQKIDIRSQQPEVETGSTAAKDRS